MHFLRFGSSIPGDYWGCCAVDIIQNFHKNPDEKVAIQLVSGDGGYVLNNGGRSFVGTTYREIFSNRIRFGTFNTRDMPNHGFIAVITRNQLNGEYGKKWLAILKEHGFEFIRAVSNSVGQGATLYSGGAEDGSLNYVFALFRNIGSGRTHNPFAPPKEWLKLPDVKPEAWEKISSKKTDPVALARKQEEADLAVWNKVGPPTFITEEEAEKAGCKIVLAGQRSRYPQQTREERAAAQKADKNYVPPQPSPFAKKMTEPLPVIDMPQVKQGEVKSVCSEGSPAPLEG